jgi:hypothetical protein
MRPSADFCRVLVQTRNSFLRSAVLRKPRETEREEGGGEEEIRGALGQNSAVRIGPILFAIRVSAMALPGRSAVFSFVEFGASGCDDDVRWNSHSELLLASSVEWPIPVGFATKGAIRWFWRRTERQTPAAQTSDSP